LFTLHYKLSCIVNGTQTSGNDIIQLLQSLVDEAGLNSVNKVALKCADALAHGDGKLATSLWDEAEKVIDGVTSGVNLYNILKWNDDTFRASQNHSSSKLLSNCCVFS